MEFRNLGRSGLKVSAVGLGCNNMGVVLDDAATQKVVDKAIDLGVNFFDTADVYGAQQGQSESALGKAVGTRRSQVCLATKLGLSMEKDRVSGGGASRGYVMGAAEGSLRRLGTDYIDLYQLHGPDPLTPIEETMRALDDLVRQGKVRYIGLSNFPSWQIADAAWTAQTEHLTPFISSQNRYNVLTRTIESELMPACQAHGLGILPFFPLESGILTGKYTGTKNPPPDSRAATWNSPGMNSMFLKDDFINRAQQLATVAAETGGTILQLALGWLLSRPGVASVIAGATKPEQVEANVKAAEWRPTADQLKRIDEISPPAKYRPF